MSEKRLMANKCHPTFKKIKNLIDFLDKAQLEIECVDGGLRIRDYELCVSYDLVSEHDNAIQTDLPPLFAFKLTRELSKNKHCKCSYCKD